MSKGRISLAVVAGAVFWGVFWVGGAVLAQRLWPELIVAGQRTEHVGVLLGFIVFSVVLSTAAGFIAAAIEKAGTMSVWILAGLQLALGLLFEITAWQATPVWYHVIFLALIVPATLFGGSLVRRGSRRTSSHTSRGARAVA